MNAAAGTGGSRRHPQDLERDSQAIRADMDRTLEELEQRFSPREMVDRSIEYVREHGSEIAGRIGDTVRANPIPVALTAAGLVWLTASVVRQRREELSFSDEDEDEGEDESQFYEADALEDEGDEDWQDVEDAEYAARSESAQEEEEDTGPRVIRHKLMRSARTVRQKAGEARRTAAESIAEQPVFWGMLALAAGALLGSALPATEYERRAMSMRPPTAQKGGDGKTTASREGTGQSGTESTASQAGKESSAYGA